MKPYRHRFLMASTRGLLLGSVFLLANCAGPPPPIGELKKILDDGHRIEIPSKREALATGSGCAGTREAAMKTARRVAEFNLRSLTGAARYSVGFRILKVTPESGEFCVEVAARAIP